MSSIYYEDNGYIHDLNNVLRKADLSESNSKN